MIVGTRTSSAGFYMLNVGRIRMQAIRNAYPQIPPSLQVLVAKTGPLECVRGCQVLPHVFCQHRGDTLRLKEPTPICLLSYVQVFHFATGPSSFANSRCTNDQTNGFTLCRVLQCRRPSAATIPPDYSPSV